MTPSTNVGAQPFTGSSVGNSGGNVGAPSQGPQQQGTNTIHGSSKNGLSRTAPSPGQGPTTSNSIQQASTGTPYQVITPGGHPPPTMPNQFTSISQTGTSIAGGIAAMPGQAIPAQAGVAASGANMMLSMSTSSSIANSSPYQFP